MKLTYEVNKKPRQCPTDWFSTTKGLWLMDPAKSGESVVYLIVSEGYHRVLFNATSGFLYDADHDHQARKVSYTPFEGSINLTITNP